MDELREVDSVEILVLVDNATDNLSTTPAFVETEVSRLVRRGVELIAGSSLCTAAHGLALLVTTRRGDETRTLLFDAGPDGDVLERNVHRLAADLGRVDGIVLSHGHWDHGGGMLRALDLIRAAGGRRELPYYAHPGMFGQRAAKRRDGTFRRMEDVPSPDALAWRGTTPVVTTEPQVALDAHAFVSGEIPRVTPFETGLPGQHRRAPDGSGWEPDELVLDERFVAIRVQGKGLVVLTACSHAGVINVLTHAREILPDVPLYAVLGGLHLSGENEQVIPQTVEELRPFGLEVIAPGHCTGWRAVAALLEDVGDRRLVPLAVGKQLTL
ncbi:MAG: MBL fold metallo-hydrolase [Nitriliruptoraceae bacterium]